MDLYSLYSTDETIQIPYKYLQPPLPISAFSQHEGSVITLADSMGGAIQCHGDLMLSESITDGEKKYLNPQIKRNSGTAPIEEIFLLIMSIFIKSFTPAGMEAATLNTET